MDYLNIPDLNYVWIILIFFTVFMIVYNGVIIMGEPYLPAAVLELFRYGKTLNGPAKTSLIRLISVPKSYFTHFYIFSSIYVFITLIYVIHIYTNNKKVDESVLEFLDLACSSQRSAGTSSSQLLIVLVLLMIQVKKKSLHHLHHCIVLLGGQETLRVLVHQPAQLLHHEHHSLHCWVCSLLLCNHRVRL